MDRFEQIPAAVHRHAEAWYSFPQSFPVPEGWWYRTDTDKDFRYAPREITVDLFCRGDWMEMVNPEENTRIIHEIY